MKPGHTSPREQQEAIAKEVYAFLLERGKATLRDITDALQDHATEIGAAISALTEWGLLQKPGDDGILRPISPEAARRSTLTPLHRTAQAIQATIAEKSTALDTLAPVYETHVRTQVGSPDTEEVHSLTAVRDLITGLSSDVAREVMTSQPGGPRPEEEITEALSKTEDLLARGIRMRALYQHAAQFSHGTTAYVERVTQLGAEVRTTMSGFPRLLIFDRSVAILSLEEDRRGALICRNPSIVSTLTEAFDHAWTEATPFPTHYNRTAVHNLANEIRTAIALQLVEGVSDRKIAESIGLSLRAVQRHIAETMKELGASNRLHAGYLLHEKLNTQKPPTP